MHVAGGAQEQIVSEASGDDSESNALKPAPTLPKLKKTAPVVPTRGTAAGEGTPSSSKKQGNKEGKESDKAKETDDEDGDKEEEEEDLDQVLERHKKRKRAPASHIFKTSQIYQREFHSSKH